jgi:4-diphosphocytidyl-2-C-methyl-D-erythritol kinase
LSVPAARFVVVKPQAGLDTSAIFRAPELKRDSEPAIILGFAADPLAFGRNDLQPVAERLCPPVAQAILAGAARSQGRMTGSGSAVFALLAQEADVIVRLVQCAARLVDASVQQSGGSSALRLGSSDD